MTSCDPCGEAVIEYHSFGVVDPSTKADPLLRFSVVYSCPENPTGSTSTAVTVYEVATDGSRLSI